MKNRIIIVIIACLLLGGGYYFFVGSSARIDSVASTDVKSVNRPSTSDRAKPGTVLESGDSYFEKAAKVNAMSLAEIKSTLDSPESGKLRSDRNILFLLFERYASLDPQGAYDRLDGVGEWLRLTAMAGLFTSWGENDPQQAIAVALEFHLEGEQKHALDIILRSVSMSDPQEAYNLALKYELEDSCPRILMKWAERDPITAFDLSRTLEASNRSKSQRDIMETVSMKNPELALELFASLTDLVERKNTLRQLVRGVYKSDPNAALELLATLTDSSERILTLRQLIGGLELYNSDPNAVEELQGQLQSDEERSIVNKTILAERAKSDPRIVGEELLASGFVDVDKSTVQKLINAYTSQDLAGARSYVGRLTDPNIKKIATGSLLSSWSQKDPIAVLRYLQSHPDESEGSSALSVIAKNLESNQRQAALNIINSQESLSQIKGLQLGVYRWWILKNPEAAASSLSTRQASLEELKGIYHVAGLEFGRSKPSAALEWINSIPESKQQNAATSSFVYAWSRNEPDNAAQWVNTLSAGGQRDVAVTSLVRSFDHREPDYALEWAATISDEQKRLTFLEKTYDSWARRNEQEAADWLNATTVIPYEVKKALRN